MSKSPIDKAIARGDKAIARFKDAAADADLAAYLLEEQASLLGEAIDTLQAEQARAHEAAKVNRNIARNLRTLIV